MKFASQTMLNEFFLTQQLININAEKILSIIHFHELWNSLLNEDVITVVWYDDEDQLLKCELILEQYRKRVYSLILEIFRCIQIYDCNGVNISSLRLFLQVLQCKLSHVFKSHEDVKFPHHFEQPWTDEIDKDHQIYVHNDVLANNFRPCFNYTFKHSLPACDLLLQEINNSERKCDYVHENTDSINENKHSLNVTEYRSSIHIKSNHEASSSMPDSINANKHSLNVTEYHSIIHIQSNHDVQTASSSMSSTARNSDQKSSTVNRNGPRNKFNKKQKNMKQTSKKNRRNDNQLIEISKSKAQKESLPLPPPIIALTEEEEDFPEDLCCPVCWDIYYNPYKCCPCQHIFCELCLRKIAKYAHYARKSSTCPVCRSVIQFCDKDYFLMDQIKKNYSWDYNRRRHKEGRNKFMQFSLPYESKALCYDDIHELVSRRRRRQPNIHSIWNTILVIIRYMLVIGNSLSVIYFIINTNILIAVVGIVLSIYMIFL